MLSKCLLCGRQCVLLIIMFFDWVGDLGDELNSTNRYIMLCGGVLVAPGNNFLDKVTSQS